MIAPIRLDPEDNPQELALREARRAVASLLPRTGASAETTPQIPAWQAWLLVGWMAVTALAFLSIMAGNLKETDAG